jgi:hypothetical protein
LVSFSDGGNLLGTAPISDGIAALTVSFDRAGSHSLSASAAGSSLADSDPVIETVDDNSTSFWFTSVAGSVPNGAAGSYTPAADAFDVIGTLDSLNINIGCSPGAQSCFFLFLSPPSGQEFAPGTYTATTFSIPPPPNTAGFLATYGGFDWFGPATFIIHSVGTAADGTIDELDVSVSSVCDGLSSGSCFTGDFRYNVPDTDLTIGTVNDVTTPATSPSGATVSYLTPTVSDPDDVTVPTPVCNPASGSNFPIGLTTVTCSVSDVDDTPSTATTTFTVTVEGTAAQLLSLASAVQGVGPGTSLLDKVHAAQSSLNSGNIGGACTGLAAFTQEVHAQAGKSFPAPQAIQLIANAQRIQAVLAC